MKNRTICVVLTARGNYAKMKSVLAAIDEKVGLDYQVILGGSLVLDKYGKIMDSTVVDKIMVDSVVYFLIEGETPLTMAKSAGLAVTEFAAEFQRLKPDAVIVIADRFESLAIAMAASYMNIPVIHIEGGELSGSIDEPIRHAVTKLAHLHFPASKEAAERIIRMGENPESVFPVGSTSLDILNDVNLKTIEYGQAYQDEHGVGRSQEIRSNKYLIVVQHPVTTEYDKNYSNMTETVLAIDQLRIPTLWIWPNMDAGSDGVSKRLRDFRERSRPRHVRFLKSVPIEIFGAYMKHAACIVGNSSSGIREASYLGTPCVNIGSRQTGRARGANTIDVQYSSEAIVQAVLKQLEHGKYESDTLYGDGKAGEKIVDILEAHKFTKQKQNSY